MGKPKTIDEYIAGFPEEVQDLLNKVRTTIQKAAPGAVETISYGIPAFRLGQMLVWFAAHSHHIGFYPRGSGIEFFSKELSKYKNAKGSVQFPFDQPIPVALISKIVKFRVKENLERSSSTKH